MAPAIPGPCRSPPDPRRHRQCAPVGRVAPVFGLLLVCHRAPDARLLLSNSFLLQRAPILPLLSLSLDAQAPHDTWRTNSRETWSGYTSMRCRWWLHGTGHPAHRRSLSEAHSALGTSRPGTKLVVCLHTCLSLGLNTIIPTGSRKKSSKSPLPYPI